jgi:hypothetical protein
MMALDGRTSCARNFKWTVRCESMHNIDRSNIKRRHVRVLYVITKVMYCEQGLHENVVRQLNSILRLDT